MHDAGNKDPRRLGSQPGMSARAGGRPLHGPRGFRRDRQPCDSTWSLAWKREDVNP